MTELILPPGTGVMVCGHGSRNQLAVGEFAKLAEALRARLPGVPVDYGYLEFANPVIHKGLDALRAQGVKRVLALPGMLFAAGHAKNDIPSVLNSYAALHDGFKITYGRELGIDLKMIRAAGDRIAEAEAAATKRSKATTRMVATIKIWKESLIGNDSLSLCAHVSIGIAIANVSRSARC